MTLIKSISGMRGTIGGKAGDNLTPIDLVLFVSAFATLLKKNNDRPKVVIGRDGRISGESVKKMVLGTLSLCGLDVIDLDLSTTPTVEMAVKAHGCQGGIILTASHNPKEWNALKFLNEDGEFISAESGERLLDIAESGNMTYADIDEIGKVTTDKTAIQYHVNAILDLEYIDVKAVQEKNFKVVVDAVNSTGALAIPILLEKLNVSYEIINGDITGEFAHNPEPLPDNLGQLMNKVKASNADLGIAVDPDVDRLAFVSEDGSYFGEEYTLVAIADHILTYKKGPTVSNLSSSRALTDLSGKFGVDHYQSAVGEVNVVEMMKSTKAVIGGEGNGGVILPELHYGRDALVGIALILTLLAKRGSTMSQLRSSYTNYDMVKSKMALTEDIDPEHIIEGITEKYVSSYDVSTVDGVKVNFEEGWVHLRKSNTEPIIRIYAEAQTRETAETLVSNIKSAISELI